MDDSKRRLIWHGMFLFLLGLLTGFVETKFTNQRSSPVPAQINRLNWLKTTIPHAYVSLPPLTGPKS